MVALAATLGDGPFPRTGGWEKATGNPRKSSTVEPPSMSHAAACQDTR